MNKEKPTHAVAEGVPEESLIREGEDAFDPHVWFDIELWQYAVDEVVKGLSEVDKDHADEFKENGENYKQELTELDAWAKESLHEIPEKAGFLSQRMMHSLISEMRTAWK